MKKFIIIGIGILICASLVGATIGFFVGHDYTRKRFFRQWHGDGRFKERIMSRLDKRLNLDPQQHETISRIFEGKREQMKTAKNRFKDDMARIKNSAENEIRSYLRPDQIEIFDKMIEERKERMKKWQKKCLYGKGGGRCRY